MHRKFEVHAVFGTRIPPDAPDGVHWHGSDLLAPGGHASLLAAVEPSHLLHLAWYAEHGSFWQSLENLRWTAATVRLVHDFAAQGGQRAVLAGTCAEYCWDDPGPCREDATPLTPATLYGTAKLATYEVLQAAAPELAIQLACGRVFFLYGPGEAVERLVPSVARGLLAGERVATGDGCQVRDFLHVADAAGAFAALVDSPVTGAVNIASGHGRLLREVIDAVAAAAGHADLLNVGALPPRQDDPRELVADVSRLRDEVGFVPNLDLHDGIEQTVAWWKRKLATG